MSNNQNASISSSIQPDSFSSFNFQRQLMQRRSTFGVSTPAAQFNQNNCFQRSGQMRVGPPKFINGLPAEEWHSMSDERRRIFMQEKRKNSAFKTEMCKGYVEKGFCDFGGSCRFAHSQKELRLRPVHPKFKSELCRNYAVHGSCVYGSRCQFIHRSPVKSVDANQLHSSLPSSRQFSYSLQQLRNQFTQFVVSDFPRQSFVSRSSYLRQMPSCMVCSEKESVEVVKPNQGV